MHILRVPVTPFAGQRPGTSGLRKKVAMFREPGYVEAFVQSLFDALPEAVGGGVAGQTLVLGGDGRFFNDQAIQTIIRMAAANGVVRLLVGRDGFYRPRRPAPSSANAAHLAASFCRRAITRAAPMAISASSTMSAMAAQRPSG